MSLQPRMRGDAVNAIYLHGFASSAGSTKGAFFASKLREQGITLHSPDFNEPDFSTLTITRMVTQVERVLETLPAGPVVLIGSSLGGFVALQVALRHPVDRLVLLAPAIDFTGNRLRELGDRGLDAWEQTGQLNVFHYGYGRIVPVHYGLYTDAARYSCAGVRLEMPIQIFQGRRDTAVSPVNVERWARQRPNVELHMLDDDHQLTASLNDIWREMERFLTPAPEGASTSPTSGPS
ncbi:MAG TPA: YqiA/YcfP family alpha/beta fold hydrolase [Vicinamibacterales bacterium]|nr:YqiA/YcfP family alpha/beta fold hydrolase [Vicinamibacterales bacterium]